VSIFLCFSRKRQDGSAPNFFQGLGENTCLLHHALKNTAPVFNPNLHTLKSAIHRTHDGAVVENLTKKQICTCG